MKLGFLGGSFDPVHFGHLCAAQDAYERLGLDRVYFVPAAQAPLKSDLVRASAEQRLAVLRSALGGDPRFGIADLELRRGGTSYTIDTVLALKARHPTDRLFWIIGADQLQRLSKWMRIAELAREIEFICLERPGSPSPEAPEVPGLRLHHCPGHLMEISSTEIRERVSKGLPLDCFMPHKAIVTLLENRLYTNE